MNLIFSLTRPWLLIMVILLHYRVFNDDLLINSKYLRRKYSIPFQRYRRHLDSIYQTNTEFRPNQSSTMVFKGFIHICFDFSDMLYHW